MNSETASASPKLSAAFDSAPRLVAIGNGRRLAVEVKGTGPTVVLDGGGSGYGVFGWWGDFDRGLAKFATVVTYDRLGCGYSDGSLEGDVPLTEHAHNLAALLDRLPVEQPVVLVGWSFGGLTAQQFACLYPQKVAAILLLDPTMLGGRGSLDTLPAWQKWMATVVGPFMGRRTASAVRSGTFKNPRARERKQKQILKGFGPHMPPTEAQMMADFLFTHPGAQETLVRLIKNLPRSIEEVRTIVHQRGLPRVPLKVLMSGHVPKGMTKLAAKISAAYAAETKRLGGELRVLGDISHQIPFEAPAECIRAVRELLARGCPE
jgi:pimeloyl-ACP methyl ester carboxylesterase